MSAWYGRMCLPHRTHAYLNYALLPASFPFRAASPLKLVPKTSIVLLLPSLPSPPLPPSPARVAVCGEVARREARAGSGGCAPTLHRCLPVPSLPCSLAAHRHPRSRPTTYRPASPRDRAAESKDLYLRAALPTCKGQLGNAQRRSAPALRPRRRLRPRPTCSSSYMCLCDELRSFAAKVPCSRQPHGRSQ